MILTPVAWVTYMHIFTHTGICTLEDILMHEPN